MSAYEELTDRCCDIVVLRAGEASGVIAKAIIAEVLRTLETLTPEMADAWWQAEDGVGEWLAMLHASPLAPK